MAAPANESNLTTLLAEAAAVDPNEAATTALVDILRELARLEFAEPIT
jgi:hypothetical protein